MVDPEPGTTKISIDEVRTKFNTIKDIWDPTDKWHLYTRGQIEKFIHSFFGRRINGRTVEILNAGSAGDEYGLSSHKHLHVDIADKKLENIPNKLVANIEDIPLENQQFDLCLCVGSVINYCDAVKAIQEFGRLLKKGGWLILEFENSKCFEYSFQPQFGQSAAIVETFYNDERVKLWAYTEGYIVDILGQNHLKMVEKSSFHILSSLVYRISRQPNFSASFAGFDRFLQGIRIAEAYASNVILACEKTV